MTKIASQYYPTQHKITIGQNQAIFINSETDTLIDSIVKDNLPKIKSALSEYGIEFIYIPELIEGFNYTQNELKDYTDYHYPFLKGSLSKKDIPDISLLYKHLINNLGVNQSVLPCVYTPQLYSKTFKIESLESFDLLTRKLDEDQIYDHVVMFRSCRREDDTNDFFEDEMDLIVQEVAEKIRKINSPNAFKLFVNLLAKHTKTKTDNLSRLKIDDEYRIFLVDYDNIEIHLTPLQKTVYLFFLNHPEGIMFHDMPNYRDELLSIYLKLSSREDFSNLKSSIDDLVNPRSNSLSEKCSKIRNAFLINIDDNLALHYYISGERGKKKRIILDRKLIEIANQTKSLSV